MNAYVRVSVCSIRRKALRRGQIFKDQDENISLPVISVPVTSLTILWFSSAKFNRRFEANFLPSSDQQAQGTNTLCVWVGVSVSAFVYIGVCMCMCVCV